MGPVHKEGTIWAPRCKTTAAPSLGASNRAQIFVFSAVRRQRRWQSRKDSWPLHGAASEPARGGLATQAKGQAGQSCGRRRIRKEKRRLFPAFHVFQKAHGCFDAPIMREGGDAGASHRLSPRPAQAPSSAGHVNYSWCELVCIVRVYAALLRVHFITTFANCVRV